GSKEKGFLPEAFINLLALLGWNDGTEQEIFTKEELIQKFSMQRVHSGGAKFDYEKAKWFNHEWMKRLKIEDLRLQIDPFLDDAARASDKLDKVIALVKDRCTLLTDFAQQSSFFFTTPTTLDVAAVKPKWNEQKAGFFQQLTRNFADTNDWSAAVLENNFQTTVVANQLKPGEVLLPLRIMLVGGKFGPGVFEIAEVLGKEETLSRIQTGLEQF
ncbi:MAG TPA: glutamate--tRNA ligase family protein, partial [Chitinophagaceae bacterium]|nr:glutamate--tRNA ligase family protein [Chitinophagaceae bacterium]